MSGLNANDLSQQTDRDAMALEMASPNVPIFTSFTSLPPEPVSSRENLTSTTATQNIISTNLITSMSNAFAGSPTETVTESWRGFDSSGEMAPFEQIVLEGSTMPDIQPIMLDPHPFSLFRAIPEGSGSPFANPPPPMQRPVLHVFEAQVHFLPPPIEAQPFQVLPPFHENPVQSVPEGSASSHQINEGSGQQLFVDEMPIGFFEAVPQVLQVITVPVEDQHHHAIQDRQPMLWKPPPQLAELVHHEPVVMEPMLSPLSFGSFVRSPASETSSFNSTEMVKSTRTDFNTTAWEYTTIQHLQTSSFNLTEMVKPTHTDFNTTAWEYTTIQHLQTSSYGNNYTVASLDTFYNSSKLCGFPGFCSTAAAEKCSDTILSQCGECDMVGAAMFASIAVLLALLIILGNALVIASVAKKNNQTGSDFFSKIKFSLAVADVLAGLEILCVAMYNFSWTINSTANQLDQRQLSLRGSPQAIAGGIFYLLGFTSSLYHLVFLGIQRLYAIWRPMRYKLQGVKVIYVGLAVVWLTAIITATVPLWFPDVFTFSYIHTIFLYNVAISDIQPTVQRFAEAMVIPVVMILVPYLLMTLLSVLTAVLGHRKVRSSRRLQRSEGRIATATHKNHRKERQLFRTVAFMQLGFAVTLVPVLVATMMSYTGLLDCEDISLPYLVCFYVSMSNSLVNVIVYSARDASFRSSVMEILRMSPLLPRSSSQQPSGTRTQASGAGSGLSTPRKRHSIAHVNSV